MAICLKTSSCFVVSTLILVLIAGCSSFDKPDRFRPQKRAHALKAGCDANVVALQKHFEVNGIKVISTGQDYLLDIPAANLFADQSPRILWGSYALLNDVACYLKQFRKVSVTVTSHASKYVSMARERALTLARSKAIGDYLGSQAIDSRFIFTDAAGSDKPIEKGSAGGDRSLNSRITITFRREFA